MRNNLIILLTFFVIGFLVHIQSLQMVPYGDDWRFIYNYFTHEEVSSNFSPFPGIFAYMAPYGPSVLTIGLLYQFFGSQYYIYYLIPILFKVFTSFVIFLILKNISKQLKKGVTLISFISALLFLVGPIGIQAIDWAFHINVYIAIFILSLGLLFQIKFYNEGDRSHLLLGLFLSLLSILIAPFRLLSVVLLIPLIDLILLVSGRNKDIFSAVLLKNIIFVIIAFIFFWIGLFGHGPADIYSPFPITESIKQVIVEPILSSKVFLHWIGVTIVPAYPAGSANSYIFGAVFLLFLVSISIRYKGKYLIVGSVLYLIPLFLMWMVTPLRAIDSGDRYLPLSFFGLCFLVGVLSLYLNKLRYLSLMVILSLVILQAFSTVKIYTHWLQVGRGDNFAVPAQEKIMSHFSVPIMESKIIYLDFDDPSFQQSIEFGLGYRIAVLSGTKGLNNLPIPMSNKDKVVNLLKGKLKEENINQILGNIYAFKFKNRVFTDETDFFRMEIKEKLTEI